MDKTNSIEDIAKKVWIELFHPLPKASIVRIKNRAYKKGDYLGRVYGIKHNSSKGVERDWCYIIVYLDTLGFVAWVKPESIIEVIRYGKKS